MTDLLDRAEQVEPEDRPTDTDMGTAGGADARADSRVRAKHWALAAMLLGAGAIHLAMAPSHLGESAVEGTGFVVAG